MSNDRKTEQERKDRTEKWLREQYDKEGRNYTSRDIDKKLQEVQEKSDRQRAK